MERYKLLDKCFLLRIAYILQQFGVLWQFRKVENQNLKKE